MRELKRCAAVTPIKMFSRRREYCEHCNHYGDDVIINIFIVRTCMLLWFLLLPADNLVAS